MTETKRLFLAALERRRKRGPGNTGPFNPAVSDHDSHDRQQTALARPHKTTRKAKR